MAAKLYGLLGRTLKHSYSVQIHRELGCGDYRLLELEPDALQAFFQRSDIGGLNVTIPYKRDVMPLCDSLDAEALAIGSVNTIVADTNGKLHGYNTDAYGLRFLADCAGIRFAGKKVVIFGSGGASLTAQAVARAEHASEVVVISRSGANGYGDLDRHADAQILMNATPLGMYPNVDDMPADPARFPDCSGVLDMVYNPRRTAFLQRAKQLGIPCMDGLPMLVAQAKRAEELFFNKPIADRENARILHRLYQDAGNIVLIGMPGSGKSTIGKALAQITSRQLVDLDEEIVREAGCSIETIFAQQGEAAFRSMERAAVRRWGKEHGVLLVTGGGIVKDASNLASLRLNGRIYQIERDVQLLSRSGRPLSLHADLDEMYRQRQPLYEAFRDIAANNNGTAQQTATWIWREYCENIGIERS